MSINSSYFETDSQPETLPLTTWSSMISAGLDTLRQLAGTTETEFLQIGSQLQEIYFQSTAITETARHLVEVASGEQTHNLIDRLRQILDEMETFLRQARLQSAHSCSTFDTVDNRLKNIEEPLDGIQKLTRSLYVLEMSIKIESVYLGDMAGKFINLALDIKKLSEQIHEKVDATHSHRQLLATIIAKSNAEIHAAKKTLDSKARLTLGNTTTSLSELESVNERFFRLGSEISVLSENNSNNLSGVVQSMQFHDIYRQQVEHVVEALEGLLLSFSSYAHDNFLKDEGRNQALISKTGDACELQEAQLRFASTELFTAVVSIVDNLREIGMKQQQMAQEISRQTGGANVSGSSFVDEISHEMTSIADLLTTCAGSNNEMAAIIKEVTRTVEEITSYISDISGIGYNIIMIALNARIEAIRTGKKGASMSVLAEEIGHLSHEAVQRTDLITTALTQIHSATGTLSSEINSNELVFIEEFAGMQEELGKILAILKEMGAELASLLLRIQEQVQSFTTEIERIVSSINVHERTRALADEVLASLEIIFNEARALYPASDVFKDGLRQMEQRYTMESERRIHENIARKHGVIFADEHEETTVAESSDSEFGDNVDLF